MNYEIEDLKKEIYYLKKTSLELENKLNSISSTDTSEIESELSAHATRLTALENSLTSLSTTVETNTDNISSISSEIDSISSQISTLSSQIDTLSTANTTINSRLDSVESDCSSLSTTTSSLSEKIEDLESTVSDLQNNSGSSSSGSTSSGSGETVTVLYDYSSDDSTLNKGLTSGVPSGTTLSLSFGEYKKLRFYAQVGSSQSIQDMPIYNRKKTNIDLFSISSNYKKISVLRVLVPLSDTTYIDVKNTGIWALDTDTGTITFTNSTTAGYLYRIEGIS